METEKKICLYCSTSGQEKHHDLDEFLVGKREKITEYCIYQFSYCSSCKCFKSKSDFENEKKTCLYCTSRKRKISVCSTPANNVNSNINNNTESPIPPPPQIAYIQIVKIKYNPFIVDHISKVKFYQDTNAPQNEVRSLCNPIQLSYQIRLHEKGQILINKFTFKGNLENDYALSMALEFLVKNPDCLLKFKLQKPNHANVTKITPTQATMIYSFVRHGRINKDQIVLKKGDIHGRDFEPLTILCPGWSMPDRTDTSIMKLKKKISTALPHGCSSFSEFFLESGSFLAWKGSLKLLLEWTNQLTESMVPKFLPSFQIKLTDLGSYNPKPKLYYWIKNDHEGAPFQLYHGSKRKSSPETFLQDFPTLIPCLVRLIQHACEIIASFVTILAPKG